MAIDGSFGDALAFTVFDSDEGRDVEGRNPNPAVLQDVFVAGNAEGRPGPGTFLAGLDTAAAIEPGQEIGENVLAVEAFDLNVTQPFGAEPGAAQMAPLGIAIDVAGRGALAGQLGEMLQGVTFLELAQNIGGQPGNGLELRLSGEDEDSTGAQIGGVTLGGTGTLNVVFGTSPEPDASPVLGFADRARAGDGSIEADLNRDFALDPVPALQGQALPGIEGRQNAFLQIAGIRGDGLNAAGEFALNLIDYQIGIGAVDGLDPQPLVIEIAPHTISAGSLLSAFQTGQRLDDAVLTLESAQTGHAFHTMAFGELEVLSVGMGLNRNMRVELGYEDWTLTTASEGGDDPETSSLVITEGLSRDVSTLDSLFRVGPGQAVDSPGFDGFLSVSAALNNGLEGDETPPPPLTGTSPRAGFGDFTEVEEFTWSAFRQDGEIHFSGLGLALADNPLNTVELQALVTQGDSVPSLTLLAQNRTEGGRSAHPDRDNRRVRRAVFIAGHRVRPRAGNRGQRRPGPFRHRGLQPGNR